MPNIFNKDNDTAHWCEYHWTDTNPEDVCCSTMLTLVIKKCKQCPYIRNQEYEIKHGDNDNVK